MASSLDYDAVAPPDYDRRYDLHDYPGTRATLLAAARRAGAGARVLEIGCGTGHWLAELAAAGCRVAGVDPSRRMLGRARSLVPGDLYRARAEALPWTDRCFDLVILVNVLHHLDDPPTALKEARRVLRPGGRLVSIGLDPHEQTGRWWIYRFFPSSRDRDRERYPARQRRMAWLYDAGFENITVHCAERLQGAMRWEDARRAGVLESSFTSQLGLLPPGEYEVGIQRMRREARKDPDFRLESDLVLFATEAERGTRNGSP